MATAASTAARRRALRPAALAGLALPVMAIVAVTAMGSGSSVADESPVGDEMVQQEITGLLEAGLAEDDPKVQALRKDLERAPGAADATEPEGLAEADKKLLDEQPDYDVGPVRCDVVPPDLLTVDDIEGATCVSAPQPDGTNLYVAIAPDGVARAVEFGNGGPKRLDDQEVELPGNAQFDVTDSGKISVKGKGVGRDVIDFD